MIDQALDFTAGALIVVLYASNCCSAFAAINSWRTAMPSPGRRAWALGYALASLVRPCLLNRKLPADAVNNLIRTIAPWVAYMSFGAAFMLLLAHTVWLCTGAWRSQDHLFEFATGHYMAALAFHGFHLLLLMTAPGRAASATT